jgi:photosystem II stability/assembly factor-like uncharacterized protein
MPKKTPIRDSFLPFLLGLAAAVLSAPVAGQAPTAIECSRADAVDGVNWAITDDGEGRSYVTGAASVFKSCDDGDSWSRTGGSVPAGFSLLVDPAAPSIVYAGADTGLYRSTDFGETFEPLETALTGLRVSALTARRDGTLLAGTTRGIWTSSDLGVTWTLMRGSPSGQSPRSIVAAPGNDERILVAGANGLFYRTDDGGDSWREVEGLSEAINELAYAPGNPSILFAAAWDGLYRSADAGTTWANLGGARNMDMTFDAADPMTAFRVTRAAGVLKSIDGGDTWFGSNAGLEAVVNDLYRVHSLPSGRLLAGTELGGVYMSDDGGASWSRAGAGSEVAATDREVSLSISVRSDNSDASVRAGKNLKFTVTVGNSGPDSATLAIADFRWTQSGGFAPPYTLESKQGSCAMDHNGPDCFLGTIAAGGSVDIVFRGDTVKNQSRTYYLEVIADAVENDTFVQASAQGSTWVDLNCVLIFCTTADGGGGSTGVTLLLLLAAASVAEWRRRRRAPPRNQNGAEAHSSPIPAPKK